MVKKYFKVHPDSNILLPVSTTIFLPTWYYRVKILLTFKILATNLMATLRSRYLTRKLRVVTILRHLFIFPLSGDLIVYNHLIIHLKEDLWSCFSYLNNAPFICLFSKTFCENFVCFFYVNSLLNHSNLTLSFLLTPLCIHTSAKDINGVCRYSDELLGNLNLPL